MQNLPCAIAWRYLISKKAHSAVSAITAVSVCGIAVATAAIICVLSVFNGFKSVIAGRLDMLSPDVMVTPASGKVFASADSLASALSEWKEIAVATPTLLDNALALHNGQETPVTLKGVDFTAYARVTSVREVLLDKSQYPSAVNPSVSPFALPSAVMSIGAASKLNAFSGERLLLFAPRREGRVNLANPLSSFLTDSVDVVGVYQANQQEYDDNRVLVDINVARDLLQYDTEASAVEVKAAPGVGSEELAAKIQKALGSNYEAKGRLRQQSLNFRMISIEKWVSFLLLFFILIIASFNIISSLSMLVLEKEKATRTLSALGMSRRRAGAIFGWESVLVTAIGGAAGLLLGLGLCLMQQHFGLIKLQGNPGDLIIQAYPVEVHAADVLLTCVPLIVIALITAHITASFARRRLRP